MANDLFKKIDNTLLDLQASHFQTYDAELKKLARLLNHADLQHYNKNLIEDIDLDDFLNKDDEDTGSLCGSVRLIWTENDNKNLGLKFLIIQRLSESDSLEVDQEI